MRVTVRVFAAIYLVFQLVALKGVAGPRPKLTRIAGRIVAYRPVDRVAQVVSYSPNKETFLVAIDNSTQTLKPMVINVTYTHFGYSDIKDEVLQKGWLITMKVSRNTACDETYSQFVAMSRVMTVSDEKSGQRETSKPVIFAAGLNGASLAPDLKLQCYELEKGNFSVKQK